MLFVFFCFLHEAQGFELPRYEIKATLDVQQKKIKPTFPAEINLPGYGEPRRASDEELSKIIPLIENAKKPVIYSGGGIISGNAEKELLAFAEITGFPVAKYSPSLKGNPAFAKGESTLGIHKMSASAKNW